MVASFLSIQDMVLEGKSREIAVDSWLRFVDKRQGNLGEGAKLFDGQNQKINKSKGSYQ